MGEEFEEEALDLEIIIRGDLVFPENVIVDDFSWDEFIPQDDHPEKELERQRQDELEEVVPKKIPQRREAC